MQTSHKKSMSPRMERLWKYIREERSIPLHDFSTDECVERLQVELKEGEEVLVRRIAATEPPSQDLVHLLADYRTIMNRRPHTRVTNSEVSAGARRGRSAKARDEIADEFDKVK